MFDEARAILGMINLKKMTQGEVAKILGVSQSCVANKLRLLNFSSGMQKKITEAGLSERHARALLKLKDDEAVSEAIDKIGAMRLSVAASEVLIDNMALGAVAKSVGEVGDGECISRFEVVISEAVKFLLSKGIKVRQTIEFYENKRYITVTIEDKKT
jgi:ParB-like chromosome segregation protein Spo0J